MRRISDAINSISPPVKSGRDQASNIQNERCPGGNRRWLQWKKIPHIGSSACSKVEKYLYFCVPI